MTTWQKLAVTVVAMLIASYAAGVICRALFDVALPSYIGGIVGGLTAIPVWELLKRFGRKRQP